MRKEDNSLVFFVSRVCGVVLREGDVRLVRGDWVDNRLGLIAGFPEPVNRVPRCVFIWVRTGRRGLCAQAGRFG